MRPLSVPGLRLALVAAALLAPAARAFARGVPAQDAVRPPLERGGVLELTLPEPAGVRSEWFRLDAAGAPRGSAPLAVARLVRVPLRGAGGGARLEWETHWLAESVRVVHVERLERDAIDVVRREIGPRAGRTLRVAWDLAADAALVVDVGGPATGRRELDVTGGLCTPLYLLEALRSGRLSAGAYRRLEPGAGVAEEVELRLDPLIGFAPTGVRVASWRRADGTSAGRFALRGDAVIAYQLQAGGPIARAISEQEHATLRAPVADPLSMR